jgi:hypothetical protein
VRPVNWTFWRRRFARDLRAVHYFGRTQPLNFWDSALLAEAPAHLEQIRRDGFNAVIVVVPWRGFQRTVVPPSFDDVYLGRLRRLLAMVQAAGLKSIVRVSFPWNNDPESVGDFDERALGLFSRNDVRAGWLAYLREIRRIAEAFDGFEFAFFSWEEFPSLREHMVHRTPEQRRALAASLGFHEYLAERYDLPTISRLYGQPFASLSEASIPLTNSEAYRPYVDFVNRKLDALLAHGRAVWPRLAMQVRVDMDRMQVQGENIWIENDIRIADFGMRVSYFAPSMYAQNQDEVLSAAEVLANLERVLLRVTGGGINTRHFLDQFIFDDQSPQFRASGRIVPGEMGAFLTGAARLLKRYSHGYGFWNYFDYRVNHLYNAAFLRGLQGWETRGEVSLGPEAEPRFLTLAPGASVVQRMEPHRVGWGTPHYETMRFAAVAHAPRGAGRLQLTADGEAEATIEVHGEGHENVEVAFPADRHRHHALEFAIVNAGSTPVAITDLCLWGFVYRSGIYDEHGKPAQHLAAVKAMLRG